MLPILTDIHGYNNSIFDCLSVKTEIVVETNTTDILDYMVTSFPRNESVRRFNFVYGLFDFTPIAFAPNQSVVIHFANEMFSRSQPLNDFESNVLNKTFRRLTRVKPTLPGRK